MVQASDMGEPPRESPVQLVFLVLAHENPIQLARLLRAIEGTCARIFVHIDGSRSIAPFRQATTGIKHVEFLDGADRIPVFWAGFSMVQATLNLMRRAREQVPGRARFCLLSGMDYPIKDSKTIQSTLASDKEFAAVDAARVSLQLMPLLSRELVVSQVEVSGLRANLVKNKNGGSNIDDLKDVRPGMKARDELNVLSPLLENGINKQ